MEPLLATKLYTPTTRPELVRRPRLIEKLNQGLHRKLTLISAPAGFGKTTLVTEWLHSIGEDPAITIAWLSLDKEDNDPKRFLAYFIAALSQIDGIDKAVGKGLKSILQSLQPAPVESILTSLINVIVQQPNEILFVLDDYHLIEAKPVNEALIFLLEKLPPGMHLVITTREDPLFPLSRLRVRAHLNELRAADLRFTSSEAAEFLNQSMGLNLSFEDIAALEHRTEGWIAGLQLAAIALQGQIDTSRLIQDFSGSNRLILDYLIEEVLSQQSDEIQNFLLHTAVLDRMTGALCDAVRLDLPEASGNPVAAVKGQAILEMLDRSNLFVVPLDHERQWYRYHHLFVDLLRQKLHQTFPSQELLLHSRACEWYQQNGFMDEAVEHALLAGDFSRSTTLIAGLADPLWEHGEHVKLRRWLEKLPQDWLCSEPLLCIYHAWFLFSTGNQELAECYLHTIEQALGSRKDHSSGGALQSNSPPDLDQTRLEGRLSAILAMIISWGNEVDEAIQYASSALEDLPIKDPWRGIAYIALGDAYYYKGDMQSAHQTRLELLDSCRPEGDQFLFMIANLKVATTLREMGKLVETIAICQQMVEYAKQNGLQKSIFTGWAVGLWSISLAEQNVLNKALDLAVKSMQLTRGGDLAFVGFSHMVLAKVQFYSGNLLDAEATLQKLANISRKHYLPHYHTGPLAAWQARLLLAQNRVEAAHKWIEDRAVDAGGNTIVQYDDMAMVLARSHLAQGNFDTASQILDRLQEAAEAGGYIARLLEVFVLQALADQGRGNMNSALENLMRAVTLAQPGGYVRIFVEEGAAMARLLFAAVSQGSAPGYVHRLLAAFPKDAPEPQTTAGKQQDQLEMIEPLSDRELEVLHLVAEGLTNLEIAAKLYLSLNTVKAHTRSIYSKLGINSRTQAIAKGRILGILSEA